MTSTGLGMFSRVLGVVRVGAVALSACGAVLMAGTPVLSGVLTSEDQGRVNATQAQFSAVMSDIMRSSQQPGLPVEERDCLAGLVQNLLQVTQELAGYENLLTIETKLNAASDDEILRSLMRFAAAKALDLLQEQRTRLRQTPDGCLRLPITGSKTATMLQFLDNTIATLDGVHSRL